jgi:hypothetical protein
MSDGAFGWIEEKIFGDEGGESGGGGAGAMIPAPSPAGVPEGGELTVPGVGPVDVIVQSVAQPSLPLTAAQAALAIAKLVASRPSIQSTLKSIMGAIIRRPPTAPGGQEFSEFALDCLYGELPAKYRKPLCQFLAGLDAPIGLSKAEEEVFLCLILADAFDALDIHPSRLEK